MDKLKKWGRRASHRGPDSSGESDDDSTPLDDARITEYTDHVGVRSSSFANQKRASEPLIPYRTIERSTSDTPVSLNRQISEFRVISTKLGRRSPTPMESAHADDSLGLSLIHCPAEPRCDLIFLHGLAGTSHGTWSYERDQKHFWPPWLKDDIELCTCRTFTFGYHAAIVSEFSSAGILDFAKDLLFRMKTFSGDTSEDGPPIGSLPIVLVSHSMGGLVAKKAYILSKSDNHYLRISAQIRAMVFLATPHKGSQYADLLNSILKSLSNGGSKQYVADLAHNSSALQEINEQFRNMHSDLCLISFHETRKTTLATGLKRLIVDKESSILGYPGEYTSSLVADHHGMTKFKSRQDSNYIDVRNALRLVIRNFSTGTNDQRQTPFQRRTSSATSTTMIAKQVEEAATRQRLQSVLGIGDNFGDEFSYFTERMMTGTCQWLSEKQYFRDWASGSATASNILWLTAGPGSGKSTWASFAVSWLNQSHYRSACQHHFFQRGNKQKSTVSYALRSIAFQAALVHKEFCARLLEACESTGTIFAQQKPTVIWEKVFDTILFSLVTNEPFYWVFDGLDEAESLNDLLQLLSRIKSSSVANILFLSRPENRVSRDMNQYLPNRVHREISSADFFEDINDYVRRSLRHTLSAASHDRIVDKILDKSSGSFLWVKLALDKIKHDWHTEAGIIRALTEVPEGMEAMFMQMIEIIANQPAQIQQLASKILTWAVCCFRPLRVIELENALTSEAVEFLDLSQTVKEVCAQFVVVTRGIMTLVHETARAFLLQRTANLSVRIDGTRGHEHAAIASIDFLSDAARWKRLFESLQSKQHPDSRKQMNGVFDKHPFLEYALFYWSYHVSLAPVTSEEMLERVLLFFETHVLLWINGLALTGNLIILIRAAENLKTFLKRRARSERTKGKAIYSFDRDCQLQQWTVDLVRIVGRFGNNLRQDPSCAHRYLVPFCPEGSVIYRSYLHLSHSGFSVIGKSKTWDDCLARLRVNDEEMATKLLCAQKFIIGLAATRGTLAVWHAETFVEVVKFRHNEYVSSVAAGSISNLIATAGRKTVRIWNVNTAEESFEMPAKSHAQCLAMAFSANDAELLLAHDDCVVQCIDIASGEQKWTVKLKDPTDEKYTCPRNMTFSPDLQHVAVVFRGRPVFVWKLHSTASPKRCVCVEDRISNGGGGSWNASERALWHPDNDHLLILWEDTKIMYWNITDDRQVQHGHTRAKALTLSKDGSLLLTSDASGSLSVWTMPDFRLTYQLKSDGLALDLAFTADNSRFCDIRGEFCNVWETDALVKASELDDDDRSASSDTLASEPVLATDRRSLQNVTAICTDSSDKHYCCGFDDGSVSMFDASDGKKVRNKVIAHDDTTMVIKLAWSRSEEYLASADDSSRLIVKRLGKPTQQKPKWAVYAVKDFSTQEAIGQLLFSSYSDLLLIACSETVIVIDVTRRTEICRRRFSSAHGSIWVTNPSNPSLIARITSSREKQYEWTKLSTPASSPASSINAQLDSYSLQGPDKTAIVNKAFQTRRNIWILEVISHSPHRRSIELLDFGRLTTNPLQSIARHKIQGLADVVDTLLGCFQDRVVFLDHDYWVCTWDLAPEYKHHQRHFFLPRYLVTPGSLASLKLNKQGTLLCPVGKDVVIVRAGLQM